MYNENELWLNDDKIACNMPDFYNFLIDNFN